MITSSPSTNTFVTTAAAAVILDTLDWAFQCISERTIKMPSHDLLAQWATAIAYGLHLSKETINEKPTSSTTPVTQ